MGTFHDLIRLHRQTGRCTDFEIAMHEDNNQQGSLHLQLEQLDRFDDICTADDYQRIERLIENVLDQRGPKFELPFVWHGKYRLTRYLGGGMSDVYLAEQINLHDRVVVVKILPATQPQAGSDRLGLFREESKTLAKANRQDAASMVFPIDYDVFQDHPYLVMEYVAGETLRDHVNGSELTVSGVVRLVTASARSLADAHRLDIVHGDIKPSNMMVRPDDSVQLIDFGLSAFFKDAQRTRFGGTRGYAAPEQLSGEEVDARTDIYCLGVVFKELLDEVPIYKQTARNRNLARQANQLVDEMTADAKELRPSSAEEVVKCLEGLTKRKDQNSFHFVAIAGGILALLLGAVWLWSSQWTGDPSQTQAARKATIEWVESVNGKCKLDEFGAVREVDLNNCWVDNGAIEQLNVFERVDHAMFANSNVNAEGVALLSQPLTTLVLAGTDTGDRIFPVLKKFRLTTLDLSGTKITGEGLESLPIPERLDSLGVADMPITDEHATTIARMKRLRLLNLRSTEITAAGLSKISHLELEQIDLGQCPIKDNAIAELAKIESLERIVLSNCSGLTESCIDSLLLMKNLTDIEMINSKFSDAQLRRLKALPKLKSLAVGEMIGRDLAGLGDDFGEDVRVY